MSSDKSLRVHLESLHGSRVVILGVGNALKGDDAAGPLICEALAGRTSAKVIEAGTVPENYIRPVVNARPDHLVIIDAVDFGGPGGGIRLFEPHEVDSFVLSTHTLSPHLFIGLIQQQIDVTVHLIGIQPTHSRLCEPPSEIVQAAVERLAAMLRESLPPNP
jgi:hydrogenase 3 maturation protease